MKSDYTPDTNHVKQAYLQHRYYADPRWRYSTAGRLEFDRWLEEHDRQVAEAVWDEGFSTGVLSESESLSDLEYEYGDYFDMTNPYRKESE